MIHMRVCVYVCFPPSKWDVVMVLWLLFDDGEDNNDKDTVDNNDQGVADDCMIYISVYKGTNLKIYGSRVTRH